MNSKSIFKSKTFWVNVLGAAAAISGYLPDEYGMLVMSVANVALRFITKQPTHVV